MSFCTYIFVFVCPCICVFVYLCIFVFVCLCTFVFLYLSSVKCLLWMSDQLGGRSSSDFGLSSSSGSSRHTKRLQESQLKKRDKASCKHHRSPEITMCFLFSVKFVSVWFQRLPSSDNLLSVIWSSAKLSSWSNLFAVSMSF